MYTIIKEDIEQDRWMKTKNIENKWESLPCFCHAVNNRKQNGLYLY